MAGCGLFRGLPGAGAAGNHVITTDDSTFEYLGITTFTTGELWQVLQGYSARTQSLGGVLQTGDAIASTTSAGPDGVLYYSILNADEIATPTQIMAWSTARKKYVTTDIDKDTQPYAQALGFNYTSDGLGNTWTIQRVIDLNDMLNRGLLDPPTAGNIKAKRFLLDVKNSQSGCITWSQVFKVRFTPDIENSPASGSCVLTSDPETAVSVSEADCLGPVYQWVPDFYPADITLGCVKTNRVHFRLFLYDNRMPRNNSRPIVNRGAPRMAMTPITPWGQEWSNATYDTSSREPGVLPPPEQGGDANPANPAVGDLDVTFNANTGKMEAGNKQILARLITIVPSVDISTLSATVDALSSDDIFNYDSINYMGRFAVGFAIPMMIHNGNPYHFGPAWKNKSCEADAKAKIRVVNRSSRTFAAGDVVMCTLIDGEWIIMDFGKAGPPTPVFELGEWEFSKLIADRDAYFRDQRLYNNNTMHQYYRPDWTWAYDYHISPDGYEWFYRNQYYANLYNSAGGNSAFNSPFTVAGGGEPRLGLPKGITADKLAMKNLGLLANDGTYSRPSVSAMDFIGSQRYWQTSSFDFVGTHMGGVRDGNYIGRTQVNLHAHNGKEDEEDPQWAQVYAPFWGAYFNAGYTAASIKNRRDAHDYKIRRAGGFASNPKAKYFFYADDHVNGSVFRTNTNKNAYGPLFGGLYVSPPDVNVKQMPADIACLAPPKINDDLGGQHGSPMVINKVVALYGAGAHAWGMDDSLLKINQALWINTTDANITYRGPLRWMWLFNPEGPNTNNNNAIYDPLYDYKPDGDQTLTFLPVTSDYIASWDETTRRIAPHKPESFWNSSRSDIEDSQYPTDVIGPYFFQRQGGDTTNGWQHSGPGVSNFNSHQTQHPATPSAPHFLPIIPPLAHAATRWLYAIPYAGYVKRPNEYKNYSLKHWNFGDHCGGTHGITTARVGVRIKNAQLTFTTQYRLGLCNLISTFAGGQTYYRKWGKGNDIHSHESTALHVQVCGAWPRTQTIFDSRYFAVHHFNPGVQHETFDGDTYWPTTTVYAGTPWTKNAGGVGSWWDPGNGLPQFPRVVDLAPYEVDFRIPSWFADRKPPSKWSSTSFLAATTLNYVFHTIIEPGTHINGAMVKGTAGKPLSWPLVAPPSEWVVDRQRRQMLLPFTHLHRTIGIDTSDLSVVIVGGGREYKAGDLLTVTGGNGKDAVIKVVATDNAQGAGYGGITEIDAYTLGAQEGAFGGNQSLGGGYLPVDFINPEIVDAGGNMSDSPQIYADATSGLGSGATIYFKYGVVTWYWITDKGPIRNSIQRLTPNSGGSDETHCGGLYDQLEKTTVVSMEEQTEDGRYDVFLHFHNDISHNSAKMRGPGEGFENHVSLTINAT